MYSPPSVRRVFISKLAFINVIFGQIIFTIFIILRQIPVLSECVSAHLSPPPLPPPVCPSSSSSSSSHAAAAPGTQARSDSVLCARASLLSASDESDEYESVSRSSGSQTSPDRRSCDHTYCSSTRCHSERASAADHVPPSDASDWTNDKEHII